MINHRLFVLSTGILMLIMAFGSNAAQAQIWGPPEAEVLLVSTDFSLEVGSETIKCEGMAGEGTLAKHSSTWTFTPEFIECKSQMKTKGKWTANALSKSEVTLTIPKGEAVEIEISPKCKVLIEAGGTLGSSGDFENGANGRNKPSTLTLTAQKVSVVDSPAECLNSSTTGAISANVSLLNYTSASEAIASEEELGPYWHVNGSRLKEGTKQIKLQNKGVTVLSVPSVSLEITCNSSVSEGATIESKGGGQGQDKGRFSFTSCKTNAKECTIAEPITTTPTKSYLAYASSQTGMVDVFEPTEGTLLLKLTIKGSCLLAGTYEVVGGLVGEILPAGTEAQEGLVAFPKTAITKVKHEGVEKSIEMKTKSLASTFSAAYGARLVSGEKLGVFEV